MNQAPAYVHDFQRESHLGVVMSQKRKANFQPTNRTYIVASDGNTVNSCEEECMATQFVSADFCANQYM